MSLSLVKPVKVLTQEEEEAFIEMCLNNKPLREAIVKIINRLVVSKFGEQTLLGQDFADKERFWEAKQRFDGAKMVATALRELIYSKIKEVKKDG